MGTDLNKDRRYISLGIKILISTLLIFFLIISTLAFLAVQNYINIAVTTEEKNLENVNNIAIDALTAASRANRYVSKNFQEDTQELSDILSAQNHIESLKIGKEGYFVSFNNHGEIKLHSNMDDIESYGFDRNENYFLIHDEILDYALENTLEITKASGGDFRRVFIGESYFNIDGKRYYGRVEKWEDLYIASILDEYTIIADAKGIIMRILAILVFLVIIVSMAFIYLIKRLVGDKMKVIEENARKFGKGDFQNLEDIKSRTNDEITETNRILLESSKNIMDVIKGVNESSEELLNKGGLLEGLSNIYTVGSEEIVAAVSEIARGSERQAEETMEGASELKLLQDVIREEQKNLEILNHRAEDINRLKEEGNESIEELIDYTKKTNSAAEEVKVVIDKSSLNAHKIEDASSKIKGIANQTNLLALNASIEAARVGEYGSGFAVVAKEIRDLAEESSIFAIEIEKIVKELSLETDKAVDVMNSVGEIINKQTESVQNTGEKFQCISEGIEVIKSVIEVFNESGKTRMEREMEIELVINSLSAIAQENHANTEEVSAKVEEQNNSTLELKDLSVELKNLAEALIDKLRIFSAETN